MHPNETKFIEQKNIARTQVGIEHKKWVMKTYINEETKQTIELI